MKRGYIDGELIASLVAIAFVVIVGIAAIAKVAKESRTSRACVEHGYPDYKVTWNWDSYCIKRVNQTDSVVALSKLPIVK